MWVRHIGLAGVRVGLLAALAGLAAGGFLVPAFFDPLVPAVAAVVVTIFAAAVATAFLGALIPVVPAATAGAVASAAALGGAAGFALAAYVGERPTLLVAGAIGGAVLGAAVGLASTAPRGWRVAIAAAGVAVVAAAAIRIGSATATASGGRLVVVGVDGGTWRVMDPLLERGELPTVARLRREGAHGVLWSMQPSASPLLWTTIATGRLPTEHGIHNFHGTQNDDLRATRFWEVASAHGERVGIFSWLVTWPPDPLPGFIVPGWLARDARTHPSDLSWIKTLELRGRQHERPTVGELAHGGVRALTEGLRFASVATMARDARVAWALGDPRARHRAGRYAEQALVGDVFLGRYRRERPGVAAVVFYGSDALSHAYWRYHEPEADVPAESVVEYGDSIREYYRRLDGFLARLLDTIGPETTLLIVSDHGFHGAKEHEIALGSTKVLNTLADPARFTAFAIDRKVYVTHRQAGTPEAMQDVERLAAVAGELTIDGVPVMDVDTEPGTHVVLELRSGVESLDPGTRLEGAPQALRLAELITGTSWSGSHEEAGIFVARGPGIRAGIRLDDLSIRDVTPTILTVLGYPIADDMDGRVVTELFTRPPAVQTVASYDHVMPRRHAIGRADRQLEEQLRALGYVR